MQAPSIPTVTPADLVCGPVQTYQVARLLNIARRRHCGTMEEKGHPGEKSGSQAEAAWNVPETLLGLKPSVEQWAVLRAYRTGKSIKIEAVAGAGKSTTVLMCAAMDPSRRCLIL